MDATIIHHAAVMMHTIASQQPHQHIRSVPGRIKREVRPDRIQEDVTNCAIWAGAILPVLFLIQYTRFAGRSVMWWRTPAGRAIVALDICLIAVFIPATVVLADPKVILGEWHTWLTIVSLCLIPVIIAYRMISLEYGRRQRKTGSAGLKSVGNPEDDERDAG